MPDAARLLRQVVLLTLALLVTQGASLLQPTAGLAASPTLHVSAPRQVEVGAPITIQLQVPGASGVAGYETNLVFDTAVAEFGGAARLSGRFAHSGRRVE